MRTMTHLALAAMAASALALAGCGGGGSSSSMVTPPAAPAAAPMPEEPTTPTSVDVALPELPEAAEFAFALAAGDHTIAAGESLAAGGVMLSCAEGGEDCVVTVDADGGVTATGGEVTAALTTAAAEALEEEQMNAAEMKTQRAIGQAAALANGGNGTFPTPMTVSRGAGKDASVGGAGLAGFTAAEEQPGMLGNFAGIARVNTTSASATQHLVVYTDIAAPKKAEFFESDGNLKTKAVYVDTNNDGIITLIPGSTSLTDDQARANGANLDSTIFPQKAASPADGVVTKSISVNFDSNNDNTNDQVSLPGTFDGAQGRYICAPDGGGTSCSVTVSPAGVYGFGADTWTFTPNAGQTAYSEDGSYLTFGWWMSEPAKSTGTYSFDLIGTGSTAYAIAASDSADTTGVGVTGDAVYTGNAAGRYVVGEEAGAFTADATLTAKFENATTAGSISGSINNFQGGADDMSGWSVALKKITLSDLSAAFASATTGAPANTASSSFNGTVATLGDVTAHGRWSGRFFENAKEARAADGT